MNDYNKKDFYRNFYRFFIALKVSVKEDFGEFKKKQKMILKLKNKIVFSLFLAFFLNIYFYLPVQAVPNNHVETQMIPDVSALSSQGAFWIALRMKMEEGWHTYWKNPGDSGLSTTIQWDLPAGFKADEILWPVPRKIEAPPLMTYGYDHEIYLLTRIHPSSEIKPGETTVVNAMAKWLACESICVPEHAHFTLEFPVMVDQTQDHAWQELWPSVEENLPLPENDWKDSWNIHFSSTDKKIFLHLTSRRLQAEPLSNLYFFPEDREFIDHGALQILTQSPDGYTLTIARSQGSTEPVSKLNGLLVNSNPWVKDHNRKALDVHLSADVPVSNQVISKSAASGKEDFFILILLFAFLGGFILNFMPCVLPVLSLKLLNLVDQSRQSPRKAWQQSLMFTLGVLVSFWILDGILIILKFAGHQVGWGFQFQSPAFVVFLASLFFILGLNLAGIFEIPGWDFGNAIHSRRGNGVGESFLTGILATVSATPCSAPFMGTALGFALGHSALVSFLIFTLLGLGMSFPYLVIGRFPGLLRFVPRPGNWMLHLKKILGFFLFATVIWLVWLLGLQKGKIAVVCTMIGLLSMGIASWILGRWGSAVKSSPTRLRAYIFFTIFLVLGFTIAIGGTRGEIQRLTPQSKGNLSQNLDWEPYSKERLQSLRNEGRIVFLDFTAAWCLTCLANEKAVLDHPQVRARFKALNVALLKADWTTYDERITEALAGFGRNSLPVYVLYGKDPSQGGIILPEILTPTIVVDALNQSASNSFKEKKGFDH